MQAPANHPKNQFKFALRTLRKAKQLSQEDLGALSSRTYVSSLERGLKSPTLHKVDDLANMMEVHPLTILALAYAGADDLNGWQAVLDLVGSELSELASELKSLP